MSANDKRRFSAFADFIHQTYSNVKNIADVGGSRGVLSYRLQELGYSPTIIDPRESEHPRWVHRCLRKKSVETGEYIQIPKIIEEVQNVDLHPFDLIVGLHPDEATEYIVRSAIKQEKDFAIVPCCVFPIEDVKYSKDSWCDYLSSLSSDIKIATLSIEGSNVVLYRCR